MFAPGVGVGAGTASWDRGSEGSEDEEAGDSGNEADESASEEDESGSEEDQSEEEEDESGSEGGASPVGGSHQGLDRVWRGFRGVQLRDQCC